MPLANLCSQLVVTRTRRNTSIPGSRLAPLTRRSRPALRLGRNPERLCLAIHGDVGPPQATCPTLGSGAIGVAPLAAALLTAPKGGPVSQAADSCGPCQPLTRPVSPRAGDSCRAPFPCQHPGSVTNRPSSSCVTPTKVAYSWRARVAFHRQVLSAPVSACASTAASWPPPVLRRCRRGPGFRHAFTPGAPSARPQLPPGFRQSSQATCRLSTSAAECPSSTPATSPTPAGHHGFWPPYRRATPPLASRRRPSLFRPGVWRATARSTPTAATARLGGSTPT
jgi:hypothetical protein